MRGDLSALLRMIDLNSRKASLKTKRNVRNVLWFHYELKRAIIISRKGVRVLKGTGPGT